MADIYYYIDGDYCYYTNDPNREGYALLNLPISGGDYAPSNRKEVRVLLYNDKFILPERSDFLFYRAKNRSFNDMDKWDTSNVTSMRWLFGANEYLLSLDLSKFNTSNVTNMQYMFSSCSLLGSLNLSTFDTSKVTDMNRMFRRCFELTSLNVTSFDTSNVTDMEEMFHECYLLTSLDVSSFNTSNVTSMNWIFSSATNLVTIYANENFDTSNIGEGHYYAELFYGCTSLIGGAGTAFSNEHIEKDYAIVDSPPNSPGYFTYKKSPRVMRYKHMVYIKV